MPHLFRDQRDPDEKRKEILWIAIGFIIILATWLAVVLVFGFEPLIIGMTYDEAVMSIGLGVLIVCAVLYLANREREQRHLNRRLVCELRDTVNLLDQRVKQLDGLCSTSAELSGSLDIDHIATFAVDSLVGTMAADAASLVLIDEETGSPVYARDSHRRLAPGGLSPDARAVWPGPLLGANNHIEDLERQVQAWNEAGLLCAPLRLKNGLAGVLAASRRRGFDPDDHNALTTPANMSAKAIESAQHHARQRRCPA